MVLFALVGLMLMFLAIGAVIYYIDQRWFDPWLRRFIVRQVARQHNVTEQDVRDALRATGDDDRWQQT